MHGQEWTPDARLHAADMPDASGGFHYVHTNPKKDTVLRENDHIFALLSTHSKVSDEIKVTHCD